MKHPDEALSLLLQAANPLCDVIHLPLNACQQATLAADQQSAIDVPPADNSAMDGYALRAADIQHLESLPISQRITAGQPPKPLQVETAARIFTGAEIPEGADTVVMQENTEEIEGKLRLTAPAAAGSNIRPRGQDIAVGQTVASAGQIITPAIVGLLASVGIATVPVYRPLRVALLCTGDELVEPGTPLQPGQIYNSNRYTLSALLRAQGFEVVEALPVSDTLEATQRALQQAAADADVVLSTGGVSVGEEDHVKTAVESLGDLQLWKLAIKPGKPMAFGHIGSTPFIGLPGNPLSAWVTFLFFARPFLEALQGRKAAPVPLQRWPAGFARKPFSRTQYLMVKANTAGTLELYPNQSSGILYSAAWANAIAIVPPGTPVEEGQLLDVAFTVPLLHPSQS